MDAQQTRLSCLPVFYTDKMIGNVASFSPSAGKPKEVLASWQALGVPLGLHDVEPASDDLLALAHSRSYLTKIFTGEEPNGFRSHDPALAETCRYTVGAMLAAASCALDNSQVAIAPVSGFHHARYARAGGFCTFNGLIVAARALKEAGRVDKIGIIDCDMHIGDGTESLIEILNLQDWIVHYSMGQQHYAVADKSEKLFLYLPAIVESMADCDLILYQAGADPHINDPLGGMLNTEQLNRRDAIVFAQCKARGLPVAWNLAGGYQRDDHGSIRPVLEIHDNTLLACANTYLGDKT